MTKLWHGFISLCCVFNFTSDAIHWYRGDPAQTSTWIFALGFSVFVLFQALNDLLKD